MARVQQVMAEATAAFGGVEIPNVAAPDGAADAAPPPAETSAEAPPAHEPPAAVPVAEAPAETHDAPVEQPAAEPPAAADEPPPSGSVDEAALTPQEVERLHVLRRLTGGKRSDSELLARIRAELAGGEAPEDHRKKETLWW